MSSASPATVEDGRTSRVGRGRLLPALLAILALFLALSARGDQAVAVRTGLHDGFGRLVFHWPVPIAFDALTTGRQVAVRFDRAGEIDVTKVTARLGAWLEHASASHSAGRSAVRLDLRAGATARVFRVDPYRVVVDLTTAPAPSAEERAAAAAPEPAAASAGDAASVHLTIASGAGEDSAYVDFAWTHAVAAAVFLRAGHLWVVFATESRPEDVVVPPMAPALHDYLGRGERVEASGGTALRFPLRRPLAADARRLAGMWRVRLGLDAQAPQAVYPRRLTLPTRLRLAPGESPRLVTLRDPEVGDRLTVWPLLQANAGQPRQRLVDLELLATVQGLAWRLRRDGVEARLLTDAVEFAAPGGLILSEQPGSGPPASAAGAPADRGRPGQGRRPRGRQGQSAPGQRRGVRRLRPIHGALAVGDRPG